MAGGRGGGVSRPQAFNCLRPWGVSEISTAKGWPPLHTPLIVDYIRPTRPQTSARPTQSTVNNDCRTLNELACILTRVLRPRSYIFSAIAEG